MVQKKRGLIYDAVINAIDEQMDAGENQEPGDKDLFNFLEELPPVIPRPEKTIEELRAEYDDELIEEQSNEQSNGEQPTEEQPEEHIRAEDDITIEDRPTESTPEESAEAEPQRQLDTELEDATRGDITMTD